MYFFFPLNFSIQATALGLGPPRYSPLLTAKLFQWKVIFPVKSVYPRTPNTALHRMGEGCDRKLAKVTLTN